MVTIINMWSRLMALNNGDCWLKTEKEQLSPTLKAVVLLTHPSTPTPRLCGQHLHLTSSFGLVLITAATAVVLLGNAIYLVSSHNRQMFSAKEINLIKLLNILSQSQIAADQLANVYNQ